MMPNRKPGSFVGGRPRLWFEVTPAQVMDGVRAGDYQFWALCALDHPMDAQGQPLQRVVKRGPDGYVRQPFLRILHEAPHKYGSAPWKWVRVEPDRFFELVRLHGLVMRRKVKGKVIRLFTDPRLVYRRPAG
jgi:hypothetical protein